MENQIRLLHDSEIEPTDKVLENLLGNEVSNVYQEMLKIISDEFNIQHEWRYYNDGKSWLFKATFKKKTIFWLSAWEGFIKISFYFTEKTSSGVLELPINNKIKEDFTNAVRSGKLIPLSIEIEQKEQLSDFREVVKYKISLK